MQEGRTDALAYLFECPHRATLRADWEDAPELVLAMIAVPIVIYGLMPHLHRARLLSRQGRP